MEDSGESARAEDEVGAEVLRGAAAAELGPLKQLEPPPPADAAVVGSIIHHGERLAMRSEEIAAPLARGEIQVVEAMVAELEKEGALTERSERSFGFKVCGQMKIGPAGAGTTATPG